MQFSIHQGKAILENIEKHVYVEILLQKNQEACLDDGPHSKGVIL